MKSINFLILSYNQEDVIHRSLDSILCQKEWGLNRIVVSDDCSKDNTWGVLSSYQSRYPGIVELHRPGRNLGIYGNYEYLLSCRGEADLYIMMAGDDEAGPGLLEALQTYCSDNSIDTRSSVALFFDWMSIRPDGTRILFKQDLLDRGYLPYSLFIRHHLYQRAMAVTDAVYEGYEDLVWDQGLNLTEYISDSRAIRGADRCCYVPVVGHYYYWGQGVSTTLGDTAYFKQEEIIKLKYFLAHYTTRRKDRLWLSALLNRTEFKIDPRFRFFIKAFFCFWGGLERYDCNLATIKTFFSPFILRRKKSTDI